MRFEFGWLPEASRIGGEDFRIEPLPHWQTHVDWVTGSRRNKEGWFLPPLEPEYISEAEVFVETITVSDWFPLPSTHSIDLHMTCDEELAAFLVAILGVLTGLQLQPEGWGHYYRTPVKPGLITDLRASIPARQRILNLACELWHHDSVIGHLYFGAVHWHLFGCSYLHPFERFATSYAVLDTLWRIHALRAKRNDRRTPHAQRVQQVCDAYDVDLPSWARVSNGRSRLSEIRNEYFHESRWGGQRIGFAHPDDVPTIDVELFALNTRLILAMLGDRSEYTRSTITLYTQALH